MSRAIAKEEGTDAVTGVWGLGGALFWIPRATFAILRREDEEVSGPKEIEWKDSGFLWEKSAMKLSRKKATHPSRTAERQTSCMAVSGTEHSPSERKIITGVLSRNNHQ